MAYNKIILNGKQTCDYLYIQTNAPEKNDFSFIDDEPSAWNDNTLLYANFNDPERRLNAGDSAITGSIDGYEIYRQRYGESHAEYVCTIQSNVDNINDFVIDYATRNGVDYTYYLYPNIDISKGGAALSPFVTKQLATNCPYWSLLIVDETNEENVFYLDKMFKFELNLQVDDMSNNAQISISQNFTKYPTVQYGATNYWSGSLSSLCGFMSTNCVDYIQNVNMISELKAISADTRRKFLKDIDGNLWEVNIAAPINISTENMAAQSIKTWKFSWVEVGDASGVSIVNNPNKPVSDWVLTDDGVAVPYFTYQWDEQYKWDKSYLWLPHDNVYETKSSNLSRVITD